MRSAVVIFGLILTASLAAAQQARAQEQSMPRRDYSSSSRQSYGLPEALPQQPAAANQESDNTVSIPIPGGGQITVEGPAAPVRNPLPPLGGDTWSIHQQSPHGLTTGPLGP
jgi:hypothetical protein